MTTISAAPVRGAASTHLTPEEMLHLPDDGRLFELVDGQLAEKHMSDLAQLVAGNLNDELVFWSRSNGSGRTFVESTFQCFPHAPAMVRRPDVAFITRERFNGYRWGQGHFTIAPDLVVEVVSPHDEVYELDRKIADYIRAGVRRVWVINPDLQIVRVHRRLGDLSELVGEAELADEDLLPGFHCTFAQLFARPTEPSQVT